MIHIWSILIFKIEQFLKPCEAYKMVFGNKATYRKTEV